jgi:hypothetical protein
MKLQSLLEKLALPLFLISLFFIATTFIAYFTQNNEWQRLGGANLHRILQLLDLREENTLATWFSSMIFLSTSASLVLLGWGNSSNYTISRLTRLVFQLTAIGACLLSADEVASIHETMGKWFGRWVFKMMVNAPVEDKGYLWVPLFAPLMLTAFLAGTYFLAKVIAQMPSPHRQRQWAYSALLMALICLPGVFVLESLEFSGKAIISCFEEAAEIIGMYGLFRCSLMIARQHQL